MLPSLLLQIPRGCAQSRQVRWATAQLPGLQVGLWARHIWVPWGSELLLKRVGIIGVGGREQTPCPEPQIVESTLELRQAGSLIPARHLAFNVFSMLLRVVTCSGQRTDPSSPLASEPPRRRTSTPAHLASVARGRLTEICISGAIVPAPGHPDLRPARIQMSTAQRHSPSGSFRHTGPHDRELAESSRSAR